MTDISPQTLFKALSDPTRLRCIALLMASDELCVCELTQALALPQPKVSHHLAALRHCGLVSDRRDGLWIHYRINPRLPGWINDILAATTHGTQRQEPFEADRMALDAIAQRPGNACGA